LTAVDVWAAGIVFTVLLTGKFPLWDPQDDDEALEDVAKLVGTAALSHFAREIGPSRGGGVDFEGKALKVKKTYQRDMRAFVERSVLGEREEANAGSAARAAPLSTRAYAQMADSGWDLLGRLLEAHPARRISASEALQHRFFREDHSEDI
jgi:serine/threonine protein kinase